MVHIIRIGGLLGILISLACQLLGVIDDSYTFGNFGILGVLSGIAGTYASFIIKRKKKVASIILLLSVILGIYALSIFYLLAAILMIVPVIIMNVSTSSLRE